MDYTIYTIYDSKKQKKERYEVSIENRYNLIVDKSGWFYFDNHYFFPVSTDWYAYGEGDKYIFKKTINNDILFGIAI